MLNIPESSKDVFRDGETHKYEIKIELKASPYDTRNFATLDNEAIKLGSISLYESLCSSDTIQFGEVNTAKFSCILISVNEDLSGNYAKVTIKYDNIEIPYGLFYIESCTRKPYSLDRELIAYDLTYLMGRDAYMPYYKDGIGRSGKCSDNVKSVCNYLGIQYNDFTLPNDITSTTFGHEKAFSFSDIVKWAGEVNCGWFKMDRYGKLTFVTLNNNTPETITHILPFTALSEDYTAKQYDGVEFYGALEVSSTTPTKEKYIYKPTGSNGDNLFILSEDSDYIATKKSDALDTIGQNILNLQPNVSIVPASLQFEGRPYLEVGDRIKFTGDSNTPTETFILSQTIKGLAGLITSVKTNVQRDSISRPI